MLSVNPGDRFVAICNLRAKVMIFECYVTCLGVHSRCFDKLYTTFLVFKNGRVSNGGANNQLCSLREFMEKLMHRNEVTSRLRQSNVLCLNGTQGNFCLAVRDLTKVGSADVEEVQVPAKLVSMKQSKFFSGDGLRMMPLVEVPFKNLTIRQMASS
jgi:hypothetical protein